MTANLAQTLSRAKHDHDAIWDIFQGTVTSVGDKSTILLGYAAVALDHYAAINLLIENSLAASALALLRSIYEINWRASWVNAKATSQQLRRILTDNDFRFPGAGNLVVQLDEGLRHRQVLSDRPPRIVG